MPDLGGFAAANDLVGKSDVEVREAIGLEFLVRHDGNGCLSLNFRQYSRGSGILVI